MSEVEARPDEAPEFEWVIAEIFGHRKHAGRAREEERFGAKMLRIDVPNVEWTTPTADDPEPRVVVTGWVTHWYGGASIFSYTLTDEATAMRANRPYYAPQRYLPKHDDDEIEPDPDFGGEDDEPLP